MKKGSISFKIVIFFLLLAILINCFSFSCFAYDFPFHTPADPELGKTLTPSSTPTSSPSPSPTPTISSSPFVLPVVSIQDDTPLTSFVGTDSNNPSLRFTATVGLIAGSSETVFLTPIVDISQQGVFNITIPYPFDVYESDGFIDIIVDIDLLPYRFGTGGTPSVLFNYLVNSVSFDYSISASNTIGFYPVGHPCIRIGSFGLFSAISYDNKSYGRKRETADYFSSDSGSCNFKYDNVNSMCFRFVLTLFNSPQPDLSMSDYTLTLSNFIVNDTAVLYDAIVSDTDNITSNIDDKFNDLTQSISLSTPNTVGIINTVSEAFNNIDSLSASVLFSWTHDSFVVTLLIMVISFGLLGYIFFGKRG